MEILGLDPSLTGTGWCKCKADSPVFELTGFGSIKTTPHNHYDRKKATHTYTNQERQELILDKLHWTVGFTTTVFVGVEDYAFGRGNTDLPELQGLIRYSLYKAKCLWITPSTTTIKKWVSGKGNTPPDMMAMHVGRLYCNELLQFGQELVDNNQADAIGICSLTYTFYRWFNQLPLTQVLGKEQVKILEALKEQNDLLLGIRKYPATKG